MRRLGSWDLLKARGVQAPRRPHALGPSELGFWRSKSTETDPRALNRVPGDAGAILWLPPHIHNTLRVLGLPSPGLLALKKRERERELLEYQERKRTESGDRGEGEALVREQ